jgi:AcrR family transcriptional regulator
VDTRQRILKAALDVYGQRGFRGATTRRIAALAGVNEVTLFRHFGSKQALLAEALHQPSQDSPPVVLPAVPRDPLAELSAWVEAHLRLLTVHGQVLRASIGDLEERPELVDGVIATQKAAHSRLTRYLERLREQSLVRSRVDPDAVAAMLIAAIFTPTMITDAEDGAPAAADRAAGYARIVLAALGIEEGQGQPAVRATAPPSLPDATGA